MSQISRTLWVNLHAEPPRLRGYFRLGTHICCFSEPFLPRTENTAGLWPRFLLPQEERALQDDLYRQRLTDPQYLAFLAGLLKMSMPSGYRRGVSGSGTAIRPILSENFCAN